MAGGDDGGSSLSTEVYPSTNDCSPPALPSGRNYPITFVTAGPTALVATCGGAIEGGGRTASCLVLDPINQRWDGSRMGSLTMARTWSATTRLDIGVFIVGGSGGGRRTSEFLAAGTMQWKQGPALPVDMNEPCAISISAKSFLAIHNHDIREFDATIAGPTSNDGWKDAARWPSLRTRRSWLPGCAKLGEKVIIAGGVDGNQVSSTEVLDLGTRQITAGGEMSIPRCYLHLATIVVGAQEKVFALGGFRSSSPPRLNIVEEWEEESSTWKAANNLVERRYGFGAVVVPRQLICPA